MLSGPRLLCFRPSVIVCPPGLPLYMIDKGPAVLSSRQVRGAHYTTPNNPNNPIQLRTIRTVRTILRVLIWMIFKILKMSPCAIPSAVLRYHCPSVIRRPWTPQLDSTDKGPEGLSSWRDELGGQDYPDTIRLIRANLTNFKNTKVWKIIGISQQSHDKGVDFFKIRGLSLLLIAWLLCFFYMLQNI